AKGLEFPIVILAGLNVTPPNRATPVLWNPDGSFEVRMGPAPRRFETAGGEARAVRENELDAAERLRLLYVAATRARDHLLVSLHHKRTDRLDTHAALLCEHGCDAPATVLLLDGATSTAAPSASNVNTPSEEPGDRDAWIATRAELLARAGRPATIAATTLAQDDVDDEGLEKDEPGDDRPTWRRGRAGTSVGRAGHAAPQPAHPAPAARPP